MKEDKETLKYLEIVFSKIVDPDLVGVKNILSETGDFNQKTPDGRERFFDVVDKVRAYGNLMDYWLPPSKNTEWLALTSKGRGALLAGGHKKYQGSLDPRPKDSPWTIVFGVLMVLFSLFGAWQAYENNQSKNEAEAWEAKYNKATKQVQSLELLLTDTIK